MLGADENEWCSTVWLFLNAHLPAFGLPSSLRTEPIGMKLWQNIRIQLCGGRQLIRLNERDEHSNDCNRHPDIQMTDIWLHFCLFTFLFTKRTVFEDADSYTDKKLTGAWRRRTHCKNISVTFIRLCCLYRSEIKKNFRRMLQFSSRRLTSRSSKTSKFKKWNVTLWDINSNLLLNPYKHNTPYTPDNQSPT